MATCWVINGNLSTLNGMFGSSATCLALDADMLEVQWRPTGCATAFSGDALGANIDMIDIQRRHVGRSKALHGDLLDDQRRPIGR
jgi:hypothetical protein